MRTKRNEFPDSVRIAAWERCGGICECGCGKPIHTRAEYDHIIPSANGGPATLENCQVLREKCHDKKTREVDRPSIDKSKRIREKRMGLRAKSRGFDTRWRKRMDGTVERR